MNQYYCPECHKVFELELLPDAWHDDEDIATCPGCGYPNCDQYGAT